MFGWLARLFQRRRGGRDDGPGRTPACSAEAATARWEWPDGSARPEPLPGWFNRLPDRFVLLDVETTGIHSSDRIVTLAAISVERTALLRDSMTINYMHLIFDPGKKCHPEAERVHGHDDWELRHQEFFSEHAQSIREFIDGADLLIAHNAEFDMSFLHREFEHAGVAPITKPAFCTMQAYRQRFTGRANLDTIAARVGLMRSGARHGALEDCFLTLNVFLWLHDCPRRFNYDRLLPEQLGFGNLRDVPQMPVGPLPPRKRRPRRVANSRVVEKASGRVESPGLNALAVLR